jgi:CRP-like cAMP-binding protein
MFEVLFNTINEKVKLTKEEEEICKTFFTSRKLRKKQYLLQQDDVCKYTAFVEKGVLRAYTIDDKGYEHIVQFAVEGWWISDMYSFLTGDRSIYNIEALEESELLLLTKDSNEALLSTVPKMERYFRILTQKALIAIQRRVVGALSKTAEEKYNQLLNIYPHIIQRVPQHMIASYLGITPETLSRVRKQIASKK